MTLAGPNGGSSIETRRASTDPASTTIRAFEHLTVRETQVLDCFSRRLSNKEIADELYISPLTVKRHASNIFNKFGVTNRREALLKAATLGLLILP